MLDGSVSGLGQLNEIIARLRRVQNLDLSPLARIIGQIVAEGNAAGLLAGIDADGRPFAPLAESTRKHRSGSGPPGSPDFSSSALIRGFRVEVDLVADGVQIRAGWDNSVPQARFFSEGTRSQPARSLVGIRPETRAKITAAVNDFARNAVNSLR